MANKNNYQSWRKGKKKYYINRGQKAQFTLKKKASRKNTLSAKNGLVVFGSKTKQRIFYGLIILFMAGSLATLSFFAYISRGVTDISKLTERIVPQSTRIYDRTGETVLFELYGEEKRTQVPLIEIPDFVKWSTIAIEDKKFYEHGGISLWGIFRSIVWNKLRGKPIAGGSTLTQQFVKNAILSSERTITRKLKEWILAYRIEKTYSKDEILGMYFNEIPYGSTAYGVEAASQLYFGKSIRDINLAEAAILAALPQAPSKYSPYGPNRDLLIGRQQYILDLMTDQKFISIDQADEAKQYILDFQPPASNITAPHFVMYVREILSDKYGEKMVEQGGLKVITTLDLYKQEIAEEIINEHAEDNEKIYQATNAGLVSLDPKTGQILAMVGSKDYFNDDIDGQVNIATSLRQPGSSMKPLIYAASFLKGYTPNTILYDVVTNFSNNKNEPYEPHNYDLREHGPITIRKALAGSLNIPAVKALYLAGIDNVLDLARDLGYTSLEERDRFGLSLVLGGGEVKLLEHANAFGAFAREGMLHPITGILRVEDSAGKTLEEYNEIKGKKALDSKVARLINNILSDNASRAYAFGERNWLTLGNRPVAAKTGTTNDYRDAWTIGYTPSIVTGVWVGNFDNAKMKQGAAGGAVAAPIWHDFMERVLGDTPIENFKTPEIKKTNKAVLDGEIGTAQVIKIDKISGLLATEHTPEHLIEEKTFFEPHSILYYVNPRDPLGKAPKNPEKDPQFELWESRVLAWAVKELASSTSATSSALLGGTPPTESDNVHQPENIPQVSIVTPGNNQTITSPGLNVQIQVSSPRGVVRVDYIINDNLFHSTTEYPFNLNKKVDFLSNGFHNLKIKVCDDVENCKIRELEFNLKLEDQTNTGPVEINWISPSSGLAVSNIDFPLTLQINNTNPRALARVNLSYLAEGKDTPGFIATAEPIESNQISIFWEGIPASGTYTINAEAVTWSKESIRLEPITLIVNNIDN
ncbi:PBP1A family penicillin-binding protein [Candidatus Parcubacteria bacterium]|nr:PBP1A family penicillin-binding protein [Candidatus Parcubacteria bacterium]